MRRTFIFGRLTGSTEIIVDYPGVIFFEKGDCAD